MNWQDTFSLDGRALPYYRDDPRDLTPLEERLRPRPYECERGIELTIGHDFFLRRISRGPLLEIGNSLEAWFDDMSAQHTHTVVDRFEEAPGVVNWDIREYRPGLRYASILSISTLEHIDNGEYWQDSQGDGWGSVRAVTHCLNNLLMPGGAMLFTFPVGWNAALEAALHGGLLSHLRSLYLVRADLDGNWSQCEWEEARMRPYAGEYGWANAIYVVMTL